MLFQVWFKNWCVKYCKLKGFKESGDQELEDRLEMKIKDIGEDINFQEEEGLVVEF